MRYAQSTKGQVGYADEGSSPYEKSDDDVSYFGLITDDVEPPNENPHTPYATGGERRGPHVLSPDAKEHEVDVPFLVLDHRAPFEYALGERTESDKDPDDDDEDEYREHLFTEADTLPTFTLEHQQSDLDFQAWYVGCKADLQLQSSQGDALEATMATTSGILEYETDVASGDMTSLDVPSEKSPFKFWMKGDVELTDPENDDEIKTIATVTGIDLSWSNGLEIQHHGDGRDGYAVVEDEAAEKYDHTIDINVVDTELFERAAEDDEPVDVEIPFHRDPSASDHFDALYIRLLEAKVIDAPIGNPSSGAVESTIGLLPRNTEIEIREPLD